MTTINQRIDKAIAEQGSDAHNAISGPLLTLLTEFAREGKMTGIAEAFCRFRAAHPANAARVRESIPAKVINAMIIDSGGDLAAFDRLQKANSH
jgi:hypothetical protein